MKLEYRQETVGDSLKRIENGIDKLNTKIDDQSKELTNLRYLVYVTIALLVGGAGFNFVPLVAKLY